MSPIVILCTLLLLAATAFLLGTLVPLVATYGIREAFVRLKKVVRRAVIPFLWSVVGLVIVVLFILFRISVFDGETVAALVKTVPAILVVLGVLCIFFVGRALLHVAAEAFTARFSPIAIVLALSLVWSYVFDGIVFLRGGVSFGVWTVGMFVYLALTVYVLFLAVVRRRTKGNRISALEIPQMGALVLVVALGIQIHLFSHILTSDGEQLSLLTAFFCITTLPTLSVRIVALLGAKSVSGSALLERISLPQSNDISAWLLVSVFCAYTAVTLAVLYTNIVPISMFELLVLSLVLLFFPWHKAAHPSANH